MNSSTYLRAAIEILTTPHGVSADAIDTAISALRVHQEALRATPREVTLEDREREAGEIALAEGWTYPYEGDEYIHDEDGSQAYAEMLERQAEMAVMREEAAYGHGWGDRY